MIRRCLLASAGLSLALAAGCGTMMLASQGEPVWLLHRLDWTVFKPSHRVAMATFEALKGELAEVKIVDEELTQDSHYNLPDGQWTLPKPADLRIPDDYPAFWVDGFGPKDQPMIVNCRSCVFRGKTKDGKRVDAVVRLEIVGTSEQHTVVSVQAGRKGDEKLTKGLIDRISEQLQHPKFPPGSTEERAALNLVLGLRPTDDWDIDATTGDIRMKAK
jgi:hypothetical protein